MRYRTVAGIVLVLLGLGQAGLGAWSVSSAYEAQELSKAAWAQTDQKCAEALKRVGSVSGTGASLQVERVVTRDWRVALMDASAAAAYCPTRRMTYFCMGIDCGDEGAQEAGDVIQQASEEMPEPEAIEDMLSRIREADTRLVMRLTGVRP